MDVRAVPADDVDALVEVGARAERRLVDDTGAAEVLADDARHRPDERPVVLRRDVAVGVLGGDELVDPVGELPLRGVRRRDGDGQVVLVSGDLGVGGLLDREGPLGRVLQLLELGASVLELLHLAVELHLLGGGLNPELVGRVGQVLDRGLGGRDRRLVADDLVGERLVLLADVDRGADIVQDVGEGSGRQERLEHRRPVGVVGLPETVGEQVLPGAQVDRHDGLLHVDPVELVVQTLELQDLAVVLLPDDVDLLRHDVDRRSDLVEVGVDPAKLRLRRGDLRAEVGLHRVDLRDLGFLVAELLVKSVLAGAGIGELVCADVPDRAADQADEE